MLKTIKHVAVALSLIAAAGTITVTQAEARGRHWRGGTAAGVAAGTIIGLGVLGAYAAERDRGYYRSCYPGRRVCHVVGQRCFYNRYGDYRCRDDVRCHRREICD